MKNIPVSITTCIKMIVKLDGTEHYVGLRNTRETDFPLEKDYFQDLLDGAGKMAEALKLEVVSVEFCSQEEYDSLPDTEEYTYEFIGNEWVGQGNASL